MPILLCRNIAIKGQHFLPADERAIVSAIVADNDNPVSVNLVPEPDNEHDKYAVRAEIAGRKVGYLDASVSPLVIWLAGEGASVQFVATEKNKIGNFTGTLSVQ